LGAFQSSASLPSAARYVPPRAYSVRPGASSELARRSDRHGAACVHGLPSEPDGDITMALRATFPEGGACGRGARGRVCRAGVEAPVATTSCAGCAADSDSRVTGPPPVFVT
jgi:hypothetical protein